MPRRKLPIYKQIHNSQNVLEQAILSAPPEIQHELQPHMELLTELFAKLGGFYRQQNLTKQLEKPIARPTQQAHANA